LKGGPLPRREKYPSLQSIPSTNVPSALDVLTLPALKLNAGYAVDSCQCKL